MNITARDKVYFNDSQRWLIATVYRPKPRWMKTLTGSKNKTIRFCLDKKGALQPPYNGWTLNGHPVNDNTHRILEYRWQQKLLKDSIDNITTNISQTDPWAQNGYR